MKNFHITDLLFLVILVSLSSITGGCHNAMDFVMVGKEAEVFFLKVDHGEIKLIGTRRLKEANEGSQLEEAIRFLLSGPTTAEQQEGLASEIPVGTRLISYQTDNSKITLDLSQNFVSGGGSDSIIYRLEQLRRTIRSAKPARPVYLMVEGKPLRRVGGEGLMVESPFYQARPSWLLESNTPAPKP